MNDTTLKETITFDLIRKRIQDFKQDSITELILTQLNRVQVYKDMRYPIWVLFALLKWNYIHSTGNRFRPRIQPKQFDALVDMISSFESGYKQLSFKGSLNISRSLLIIVYQQAVINEHFYNAMVDRQIVLFCQMDTRFDVKRAFEDATGIELINFFNYCHFTYLYLGKRDFNDDFLQDGILHSNDYQKLFISAYGTAELDKFLKLLTLTSAEQFASLHKLGDEQLQLFETNFFLTKPFLLYQGQYINAHRATFTQTIHYFVYTFMKAKYPDAFPEDFGRRMEQYVAMGLREAGIRHQNESELKKSYSLKKVVDYLVEDDILVECKATELHPRSGVLRLPNILTNELSSSITKAYIQMLATAQAIDRNREWFGIIVTYREMYLGHGRLAWDEFLGTAAIERATSEGLDVNLVPPENLFFISVEYWDYMMQIVQDGLATMKEMLLKTRECCNSADPQKKRILMDMVLTEHFRVGQMRLSFLSEAHQLVDFVDKMQD